MGESTGISWSDATFNPWVGCEKVSPGCLGAHCYAETLVTGRMGRGGTWGAEGIRERTSDANWRKPLAWERHAQAGLLPDGKTKADHRPRVFCASLADVFEPRPELAPWRRDLFRLIEETPSLDWLLLTKRPDEARDWMRAWYRQADGFPALGLFPREWTGRDDIGWGCLPNVWIGTSIENSRFTWRADVLREIPAAVRFISAEPLLGSLLTVSESSRMPPDSDGSPESDGAPGSHNARLAHRPLDLTGIDWLICGGESGGRESRPMQLEWARELRDACLDEVGLAHHPGCVGNCSEYGCPVPEFRETPAFLFKQFGSHDENGVYRGAAPTSGGDALDGRTWHEFPAPPKVAV